MMHDHLRSNWVIWLTTWLTWKVRMESCSQFRRRVSGWLDQKVKSRSWQIYLPLQMDISHYTSLRLLKKLLSTFAPRSSLNSYTSFPTLAWLYAGRAEMMGWRDWLVLMRCERKRMQDGGVSISQVWGRLQMVSRADRVNWIMWEVKDYQEMRVSKDFRIYEATYIDQKYIQIK